MLHTENQITINATPETVYRIAANVVAWPDILPHYRYVRLLREAADRREVAMSARRSGIPVRWVSTQELRPDSLQVLYHHIGGVTRGMDVVWRIAPGAGGTVVSIDHRLTPNRWWLRPRIAQYVIGRLFVMHIADRTLRGVKRTAEATSGSAG